MAKIMTLEGLNQAHLNEIRGRLAQPELSLAGSVVLAHPWWMLGGLLLGAWLAGSTKGQGLVRRYLPGRGR